MRRNTGDTKKKERCLAPSSHPSFGLSHNASPTGLNTGVRPISLATSALIVTFHYSQWQHGDSNAHLGEVRRGSALRHRSKARTQTPEWLWGGGGLDITNSKILIWLLGQLNIFLMDGDAVGSLWAFPPTTLLIINSAAKPSTVSETVSRGTNAKWTKPGVILLESDSSLTEHGLIDHCETTQERLPNEGGKCVREREKERGRRRERGVNNIFISARIYSSQSVRHH